jgi:hypothetical protein
MNQSIKTKWAEALRSERFAKGRNHLKVQENDGCLHCCLGVLCELYVDEHPEAKWKPTEYDKTVLNLCLPFGVQESADLPHAVMKWAGLDHTFLTVRNKNLSISYLNDNEFVTFHRFATLIEAQL